MQYKKKSFDFDETIDVLNLIISLLERAIEENVSVFARMA